MVDITAKLFWYRAKEWCTNMADRVNEFVYPDDTKETVDVVNLLLLGWILLGLIVYILGNVIATQLRKRKGKVLTAPAEESSEPTCTESVTTKSSEHVSTTADPEFKLRNYEEKELDAAHSKPTPVPVCSGDEAEIVEWINKVFSWLYNQRVVSPFLDAWLSALNARTRMSSMEHGILIDFKDVVHSGQPPLLTETFESIGPKDKITVITQAEIQQLRFEILVTQFKEKEKNTFPFILNMKRVSGPWNIECAAEELAFVIKFSETPQIELEVQSVDFTPSGSSASIQPEDYQPLHDLICEIAAEALSLAIVNLRLSCFSECPKLFLLGHEENGELLESGQLGKEEKLHVKIVKASNLGGKQGTAKPYCVVEMDEPPQKFETRAVDDESNPFWDESFVFTVKDISAELLFEIYDKGSPPAKNFLGLGIVSIEELMKSPSQRQIIHLQSRPLENDNITGSLTTEFLFLNRDIPIPEATHFGQSYAYSDASTQPGKTIETNSRVTAGGTIITTTTIKRTAEGIREKVEIMSEQKEINPVSDFSLNDTSVVLPQNHEQHQVKVESKDDIEEIDLKLLPTVGNTFENAFKDVNGLNFDSDTGIPSAPNMFSDMNSNFLENVAFDQKLGDSGELEDINAENNQFMCVPVILPMHEEEMLAGNNIAEAVFYNACLTNGESNESSIEEKLTTTNSHNIDITSNGTHKAEDLHAAEECGTIVLPFPSTNKNSNVQKILHAPEIVLSKPDSVSIKPPSVVTENVSSSSSTVVEHKNENDAGTDVPGTALKELEKQGKPSAPSKSTLIIHSVQRPESSGTESLEASPASRLSKESRTSHSDSIPPSPSLEKNGVDRSRPKEKKSFIGNLRKKLSFRKPRSKSVEQQRLESGSMYSQGSNRSASTDRMKAALSPRETTSLKYGGRFLAVPGSTRSSFSEASGISTASSRTYINENSTLVVESNENGIIKRYLIPTSLIHRSKWRKRGIKLHIYNDHVFVAKHLSGSTICQVCQKLLTRRPGKQGYECRDCSLQCHKSCHVKVADYCPNSTVNTMEVEYVQDPRLTKPKSI